MHWARHKSGLKFQSNCGLPFTAWESGTLVFKLSAKLFGREKVWLTGKYCAVQLTYLPANQWKGQCLSMPSKQNLETVWPCVHWGRFSLPINQGSSKQNRLWEERDQCGEDGGSYLFTYLLLVESGSWWSLPLLASNYLFFSLGGS